MTRNQRLCSALLPALLLFLLPRPAAAYVDPAAGSMMLQLVLGGVAGLAIAARLFWGRLLALFRVPRRRPETAAAGRTEGPRGG